MGSQTQPLVMTGFKKKILKLLKISKKDKSNSILEKYPNYVKSEKKPNELDKSECETLDISKLLTNNQINNPDKPTAIVKPCLATDNYSEDEDFNFTKDVYTNDGKWEVKSTKDVYNNIDKKEAVISEENNKVRKRDGIYTNPIKNIDEEIHIHTEKPTADELINQIRKTDEEIQKVTKNLNYVTENSSQIMIIVEQFEKTIADLIKEKERENVCLDIQTERLVSERDETVRDHSAVERAYIDLVDRHQRTLEVVTHFKNKEDQLKSEADTLTERYIEGEEKYAMLKSEAEEKLHRVNKTLELKTKIAKTEVAKLEARLKREEMKVNSLEQTISRQTNDNEELTKICDELISKLSSK